MPGDVRIEVSHELDAWVNGLQRMGSAFGNDEMKLAWKLAADLMFDRSQQYVHVLTGKLKASGVYSILERHDQLEAEFVYGAPYAIYENARGGDHAFIDRAFEDTSSTFEKAIGMGLEKVVARWR